MAGIVHQRVDTPEPVYARLHSARDLRRIGDVAANRKSLAQLVYELAETILAVGRLIQPPGDQAIGACTPIESSVMRFISRNPGTSARAASEATLLTSSNFSRVLRGLEEKGLVSREPDANDARRVSLYPTALAGESRRRLGEEWYRLLRGIEDDPAKIDDFIATLRCIESELVSRRRREGAGRSRRR